jgi:hypothetical protein
MKADAQKVEAKLNRDGIVSDRNLYLAADQFTVVEHGTEEARFQLASADALIPTVEVQRLGLAIEGGKVVQTKENGRGGPEAAAGPTPQSGSWPPSVSMDGSEAGEDGPEWDHRANAPKSDFRYDPHAIRRALPTQGVGVPPTAELSADLQPIVDDAREEAKELAHARAPMTSTNLVKEQELREEGKSGNKKASKRSSK